jgi:Stage II sporulation protein E (SpoIIE)
MARRTLLAFSLAALVAAFLAGGIGSAAQMPGAPTGHAERQANVHPGQPGSSADSIAHVTLGQAAVPLYGPWKFTVGDSPIDPKTGQPLWAEPDFDDSNWETVDLTPKDRAFDPVAGLPGYVSGWTAKGHPGYWGYAWYRIRVRVRARQGEQLALAGPADMDDGYQLFDNGELAGHFGDFTGSRPVVYYAQPKMFPLQLPGSHGAITGQGGTGSGGTESDRTGPAESTRVLAFRLWMDSPTLINTPDAGGMHSAPVLGEAGAVAAGYQMRWLELIRTYASSAALALLFGLLAVVAFSLILFDRSDRVYLWMGALFLLIAAYSALFVIGSWTELQGDSYSILVCDCLLTPLIYAAWVMVFRVWFRQQRPSWLPQLTAGLTLLFMVSTVLGQEVFFGLVPHAVAVHFVTVTLFLRLLFFALLLWVVVEGIRRQGAEGWLVLPVVLLRGIGAFPTELNFLQIRMHWFPLGFRVNLAIISNVLVAVVIVLLLLRRLLQSVKRQRLMALDVKQAQEVQQVILPEAWLVLAGLTIESEYRPAREVGGDFFQIIPHKTDGSLLIVAGDVAGKGLQAGMLVALLVGTIRTAVETSDEPAAVLGTLNRRLMGRGSAQATCLAMRIEADGAVTLANAGHVVPYLNGEELPMEGALPLGMIEGAESSVMRFQLAQGDRLMLMSDGVAEATDANGKLFGFERIHHLLHVATSAAEVARAAQAFGQEDDISVISVTRTAELESAAAWKNPVTVASAGCAWGTANSEISIE